jgi:cellulose synthase/poly-beta-1,6-N-acetylglucosamine synthase-like glycosyltransferase
VWSFLFVIELFAQVFAMKISLLVPAYNEEKSIEASLLSCLNQVRPFDEIIIVNDCSKDRTGEILNKYADRVKVLCTPTNTGNKSSAQEYGLQFVTGDIIVTTDGDTLLDSHFAEEIEKSFQDPTVGAVAGYIKSLPYNWLTLVRSLDYFIGQNIHKRAQSYMNYVFVMPGAASGFRTDLFRQYITFDHDTITEDLDFTYKMHRNNFHIVFNTRAICHTQDPADLSSYINQMRRWFGGGWQNLLKHWTIAGRKPSCALELSLMYCEGLFFAALLFVVPIINLPFALWSIFLGIVMIFALAVWAAIIECRPAYLLIPPCYIAIMYINAYIYLEQFIKEIILKRKNLVWFKPERIEIGVTH